MQSKRLLAAAATPLVALIAVGLSTARPARAAQVCVLMDNSADQVAGMQLDLAWDGTCMSPATGSGTSAQCTANSATGKTANSRLQGSSMRVLYFAMDNVDPVPDGELFCCNFSEPKRSCCGLQMGKLIASDAGGRRISDPNVAFMATVAGEACAQLSPSGSTSGPAARGLLGQPAAPQGGAPVVEAGPAGGGQEPAAPQQQQPEQAPQQPAAPAPAAGAPPIAAAPPTVQRDVMPTPPAQPEQLAQRPAEVVEVPAAPGGQQQAGQAGPAQVGTGTPTPAGAATSAPVATSTSALPTATKALTKTPTVALPTATPTSGGFFSGCHIQRR